MRRLLAIGLAISSCMGDVLLPLPGVEPPGVEVLFIDVDGVLSVWVSDLADPVPIPLEIGVRQDVRVEALVFLGLPLGGLGLAEGAMRTDGTGPTLPRALADGYEIDDISHPEWSASRPEDLRFAKNLRLPISEVCVLGPGGCSEVRPDEPAAPAVDEMWWTEWTEPECNRGERATTRTSTCVAVGSSCPADGWPMEPEMDPADWYVRPFAQAGDGSRTAPFDDVDRALDMARMLGGDRVIALSGRPSGDSHILDSGVPSGVTLRGACALGTLVSSPLRPTVSGAIEDVTLSVLGLALAGGRLSRTRLFGTIIATGTTSLDDVYVERSVDLSGDMIAQRAHLVETIATGAGARLSLEDSIVQLRTDAATEVSAEGSVIFVAPGAESISVAGGSIIESAVLEGGVYTTGLLLEGVRITGGPRADFGLQVFGEVSARRLTIGGFQRGIVIGGSLTAFDALLSNNAHGVNVASEGNLMGQRIRVTGGMASSAMRCNGEAMIRDLTITTAFGITSSGKLEIERAHIESQGTAISIEAGEATLSHVVATSSSSGEAAISIAAVSSGGVGPVLSLFEIQSLGSGIELADVGGGVIARGGRIEAPTGLALASREDVFSFEGVRITAGDLVVVDGEN